MKTISKSTIITLCFIVVGLFVIPACDDPIDGNVDELLHAKVEDASRFNDVVEVKLMLDDKELASGNWTNDGFTIVLSKTVNPNNLHTLITNNKENNQILPTPIIIDPAPAITISNKNVKVVNAMFFGVDKDEKEITRFFPYDNDYPYWSGNYYFTYVDSDVNISGYVKEKVLAPEPNVIYNGGEPPLLEWEKHTTYSIRWKKGWNVWYRTFSFSSPVQEERIITEQWLSIPINRLRWR